MMIPPWPNGAFWTNAQIILENTPPQIEKMLYLLLADKPLSDNLKNEMSDMIMRGWMTIQVFVREHPPPHSRCAVDILISYICSVIGLKLAPHNEACNAYAPRALLGLCIGMIYTDGYLDAKDSDTSAREDLKLFMKNTLDGTLCEATTPATKAALAAFEMLGDVDEHGMNAVKEIIQKHHTSVNGTPKTDVELRETALELGRLTGYAFSAIINDSPRLREMAGAMCEWLQLLDDVADVNDDIAANIETFATRTFSSNGNLDEVWKDIKVLSQNVSKNIIDISEDSIGRVNGSAIACAVITLTCISYGNMRDRISNRDEDVDCDGVENFYKKWRSMYEEWVNKRLCECQPPQSTMFRKMIAFFFG